MIEFKDSDSSGYVKSYFQNLPRDGLNEILEYIPPQVSYRRQIYERYAWAIRQEEGLMTRIKTGKYDYYIC